MMKRNNYLFARMIRQSHLFPSVKAIRSSSSLSVSRYHSTTSFFDISEVGHQAQVDASDKTSLGSLQPDAPFKMCTKVAPKNEIAIIGAGIAGLGALRGMASQFKSTLNSENVLSQYGQVSIHVFEKEKTFGNGYAYSSEYMEPEHLINMPLDAMSLYPDDFNQWLVRNDGRIKQEIEHIFIKRFQKEFYNLFGEFFNAIHRERYEEWFGDAFLQLDRKYKDAYKAFESRYLCVSDPQFYAPRIIYGMYLQDSFLETLHFLKKIGVSITLHAHTEVLDIRKEDSHMRLTFKDPHKESNLLFHTTIIATGHWVKKEHGTRHYFSAWSAKESMQRIEEILHHVVIREKSKSSHKSPIIVKIAVLGSSLSAIDAIKVIFQGGTFIRNSLGDLSFTPPNFFVSDHNGVVHLARIEVDFLSRNGLMPKVRGQYGDYKNIYLTRENIHRYMARHDGKITLSHVMQLLKDDLENAYKTAGIFIKVNWDSILSPPERGFKKLKIDLEKAIQGEDEQGVLLWQTVYHQSSELFVEIYKHLPAEDKLHFDLFLRTAHFIHIAPMSQYVAEELMAMHHSGVLKARSLGSSSNALIKNDDDSVSFIDSDGQTHFYDATIVATGQHKDVTNNPTSLFKNIIQRKLMTTLRETVSHKKQGHITDRFFQATHHATNPQYDTGQVLRTSDMELIDDHHMVQKGIYIVGVASSAFGTSRASRSLKEGHVAGMTIAKNITLSIQKESDKEAVEQRFSPSTTKLGF